MRLVEIHSTNTLPIKAFSVRDLSNVVVLAGPNGVGKTRLVNAILQAFQSGRPVTNMRLVLAVSNAEERSIWGKPTLDTSDPEDVKKLVQALQKNRSRSKWESSVLNFESDRSIQQIQPYTFSWDITDPWEEMLGWNYNFSGLKGRFQDTLHSLFRKVQSRRDEIAKKAELLMRNGADSMPLDFPDPLIQFKTAFTQLLAPKVLIEPEAKQQQLFYSFDGQQFPLTELSSGEREVVNIVFDFILRNPKDSIVIFDEPELHLHPELSYKLLQTLENVGERNQFIYCTHSPDIITASLEHSVVFISPPKVDGSNQALPVREDDETHQALKLLGQSIGIVALGKRLVLIEGTDSSLDKQTYGAILKNRFPTLVLVPSGGKAVISSFATVMKAVLEKTIWGVEFFMLCDRDAIPSGLAVTEAETNSQGRLRVLKRYHLENYFLDERVFASIFAEMEPEGSWLRDPSQIRAKLKELAKPLAAYAAALLESAAARNRVGYVDIMPKGVHGKSAIEVGQMLSAKVASEVSRVNGSLDGSQLEGAIKAHMNKIVESIDADTDLWKYLVPGKPLLNSFAAAAGMDSGRLKTLYIKHADKQDTSPFQDIVDVFATFAG